MMGGIRQQVPAALRRPAVGSGCPAAPPVAPLPTGCRHEQQVTHRETSRALKLRSSDTELSPFDRLSTHRHCESATRAEALPGHPQKGSATRVMRGDDLRRYCLEGMGDDPARW